MANISGTSSNDLVHRNGDGHALPFGWTEFKTATTGDDVISTFELRDEIYSDAGADTIDAGSGDDYIESGSGNDTVHGGSENDTILGGAGTDKLYGDAGTDEFRIVAASDISGLAEIIDGGADEDNLNFGQLNAFGSVDLTKAQIIDVEKFTFAGSGNTVTLTPEQLGAFSIIFAGFGTDRFILSKAGTVDLTGANINELVDEFRGTSGADTFIFTDVANGQTANGLGGTDKFTGSLGNDRFDGGTGTDTLIGLNGNDTLIGGDDVDTISGGNGNDTVNGGNGADKLSGGNGYDTFVVSNVSEISGLAETISGGADTDLLRFDGAGRVDLTKVTISGIEQLQLNGNDITMTASQISGLETILASFGADRIILSAAGTVDLSTASISNLLDELRGSSGNDVITFAENAQGLFVDARAGNDSVTGGDGNDTIRGWSGNDTIHGGEGNDTLDAGSGTDKTYGDAGNDIIQVKQVSDISGLAETISGGADVDELNFTTQGAVGSADLSKATLAGLEKLSLGGNIVTMTGAQMHEFETISGGFGIERLIMSAAGTADFSNHIVTMIDEIRGSSGDDKIVLSGVTEGQTVNGGSGKDTISGGNGNDTLNGGSSSDTLSGSGGNDTLIGGSSADRMAGGSGIDTFVFQFTTDAPVSTTHDVITDFVHGTDLVDLRALDANDDVAGDQAFAFIGTKSFSGAAAEIRYVDGMLYGDMDGDKKADFQIEFSNKAKLAAVDFLL